MKSVIDVVDLSLEELDEILDVASDIIDNPEKYSKSCEGKKLATLFYEPSTRTRLSFEAAMLELGGSVIGFSSAQNSSASKGESIADTAKVISCYADIIAMRHPQEGAPLVAALNASIPVINAGDGGHKHPTQTLADLLTIKREKGRLDHLTVGFCGDLKYGRTVHSLLGALSRYEGINVVLISPDELKVPAYVKHDILEKNNMNYKEISDLEECLQDLDVLYMTRVQQERFADLDEYERLKDRYILNAEKLAKAKEDTIVLHPLPRLNEIDINVDSDSRACYFKQVFNGKIMRMSLILKLLGIAKNDSTKFDILGENVEINVHKCTNPRCITNFERGLNQMSKPAESDSSLRRCVYCEKKVN